VEVEVEAEAHGGAAGGGGEAKGKRRAAAHRCVRGGGVDSASGRRWTPVGTACRLGALAGEDSSSTALSDGDRVVLPWL
jgi:hypothetical protein